MSQKGEITLAFLFGGFALLGIINRPLGVALLVIAFCLIVHIGFEIVKRPGAGAWFVRLLQVQRIRVYSGAKVDRLSYHYGATRLTRGLRIKLNDSRFLVHKVMDAVVKDMETSLPTGNTFAWPESDRVLKQRARTLNNSINMAWFILKLAEERAQEWARSVETIVQSHKKDEQLPWYTDEDLRLARIDRGAACQQVHRFCKAAEVAKRRMDEKRHQEYAKACRRAHKALLRMATIEQLIYEMADAALGA